MTKMFYAGFSMFFAAISIASAQEPGFSYEARQLSIEEPPSLLQDTVAENLFDPAPQFSFASAAAAFKSARVPLKDEILGHWIAIGFVHNPLVSSDDKSSDGYWPDGRIVRKDLGSGHFRFIYTIQQTTDAFGKTVLVGTVRLVGLENGRTYLTEGPYEGTMTASGVRLEKPENDTDCGMTQECRIFQANGMLLCRISVMAGSTDKLCRFKHKLGTVSYLGLRQKLHFQEENTGL